jgi:hypothetical protein
MAFGESVYEFMEGIEGLESESESEAAEGRGRAPKRPSSAPSFRPRQPPNTPNYVTQTQLEAALARSDAKIKTVADGVSTINTRLGALIAASKKEAGERKKSVDTQSKDLNQKLQLLALLPLLVSPPVAKHPQITLPSTPIAVVGGTGTITLPSTPLLLSDDSGNQIKSVSKPDKSTLDALLPLLMVSGMGTSSGGMGFGGDGAGDSSMMMLALVLAMSNKQSG